MWRPVAPGHAATTRNEIREVSVPGDVGFAFALGMGQDWGTNGPLHGWSSLVHTSRATIFQFTN
jgi:hypothetical protein